MITDSESTSIQVTGGTLKKYVSLSKEPTNTDFIVKNDVKYKVLWSGKQTSNINTEETVRLLLLNKSGKKRMVYQQRKVNSMGDEYWEDIDIHNPIITISILEKVIFEHFI